MQGKESHVDAADFESLHHFAREVHTGRGGSYGTFVLGKDALEAFHVLGFAFATHEAGHGRFAQGIE